MRNATANFDDDFDVKEPARKKATRRPPPGTKKKKGKRRFRFNVDMKRVARYSAIGMSATVAIGIMVNALVLQKSKHPAPLFGKSIVLGESTVPAPRPAPQPIRVAVEDPETPAEAPMPIAKPTIASLSGETDPSSDDQIGRLLQGGSVPNDKPDSKVVLGAQKALVKLGFVLKTTGTFGPQTKKALEMFEKDRHLPIKGELSHRVLKALTAESGIKIEH